MTTALIAEDEPLLAAHLKAELARLWPALRIVAEVGDGLSAAREALARAPDICFLDIRMPGANGLDAAQALAEDWPAGAGAPPFPLLVFVTAYDQYALAAFDAQAVDYLVKPVEPPRLAACLARLKKRLGEAAGGRAACPGSAADAASTVQATEMDQALAQLRALLAAGAQAAQPRLEVIQAGVGNTVHLVPVAEVLYFEAADKYVRVVTAEREHLIRTSLRELLPQLDAQTFWQVHRGLVVRAAAIRQARREESGKVTLTLRGRADKLSASRLYAHLFKGM
ncbi:MAG: DNA-binding response regulator [Rubrivivax sp. SCN 71-131]|jgi:DNA-binding LytR/AlgR family response regulator|nr:MAG: DNA-binding response regulator [Rubrivivax sp. SCN 71-131]